MVLHNSSTGRFELYDIDNNVSGGIYRHGRSEWQPAVFGDFHQDAYRHAALSPFFLAQQDDNLGV